MDDNVSETQLKKFTKENSYDYVVLDLIFRQTEEDLLTIALNETDDFDKIAFLLKIGFSPNSNNKFHTVVLKQKEYVDLFIRYKADPTIPKARWHYFNSCICESATKKPSYMTIYPIYWLFNLHEIQVDTLELLLRAGADANFAFSDADGTASTLWLAVDAGDSECVELLLKAGANPDSHYRGKTVVEFFSEVIICYTEKTKMLPIDSQGYQFYSEWGERYQQCLNVILNHEGR